MQQLYWVNHRNPGFSLDLKLAARTLGYRPAAIGLTERLEQASANLQRERPVLPNDTEATGETTAAPVDVGD